MMKHLLLLSLLFAGTILAAFEKNVLNVEFRTVPDNYETLIRTEPDKWNYNFMPYGSGDDVLWSDPSIRRAATSGSGDVKRVTAVYAACNEQGLTILVFCAEPEIRKALEEGKNLPGSSLEMYFLPGDADNNNMQHWYQFIFDQNLDKNLMDYPWLERDRNFKRLTGELKAESKVLDNAYISKVFIPWSLMDNRVPFTKKADNFWRVGIMRWCPGTSQTWGGRVQAMTSAGYFRMPDFTPAQKDAIRKNLLLRAWGEYKDGLFSIREPNGLKEPWRVELGKKQPRSYMNLSEEGDFMTQVLPPLNEACNAIAADIAKYDTLTEAQKDELLIRAKRIKQFSFDRQAAHAELLKQKYFNK